MRHLRNASITPTMIENAYFNGFFPMADERGEIGFYAYEPRGIIPLDDRFTVRRSLRQILNKQQYTVTFDRAPRDVLSACSRKGSVPAYELWLSEDLIEQFMRLFEQGRAHTVEVWEPHTERLVGGLYGLAFGGVFSGESMFSRVPFASQIALVNLVEHLRARGFVLLDAQMVSEHLKQFGLYECPQAEYLKQFHKAAALPVKF
jgi:leucyl/phenylalanyl-tRNA---protein transferase